MTTCNGTSELYCSPAANDTVIEGQTYSFNYNALFGSLDGSADVDVYLYHSDNATLAETLTNVSNNGDMKFTVNEVYKSRD